MWQNSTAAYRRARRTADAGFAAHLVEPVDIEALQMLIEEEPA